MESEEGVAPVARSGSGEQFGSFLARGTQGSLGGTNVGAANDLAVQALGIFATLPIAVCGGIFVYYLISKHYIFALGAGLAAYIALKFPRHAATAAAAITLPLILMYAFNHWLIAIICAALGLGAYFNASESSKRDLYAACLDLSGPLGASLSALSTNAKTAAKNFSQQTKAAAQEVVHPAQS